MNVEIHKKQVPTTIVVRAVAEVNRKIAAELEIPDPTEEKAKAILNNENTTGNDRTASS